MEGKDRSWKAVCVGGWWEGVGFPSLHGTEPRRRGEPGSPPAPPQSRGPEAGNAPPSLIRGGSRRGVGGRARLGGGISRADAAPPAARPREDGARLGSREPVAFSGSAFHRGKRLRARR